MDKIVTNISGWFEGIEAEAVIWIVSFNPIDWALSCGFVMILWITGVRLGRFSHPAHARMSKLIRHLASAFLTWPAGMALVGVFFLLVGVAVLAFAIGWQFVVWDEMKPVVAGIAFGCVGGAIVGGFFYYRWIPGWERPPAMGVNEKVPRVQKHYDPEEFFRV